ncbi:NlpC/P60 family putative phage cell wall peptidase [Aliiruegeria haliotis]|uniref:NlpC/P60 family putative phage cell wall peptidase n=1 Tax=Aliiruegeria haliotis TaxID=1280846 RepID=A0A2T0RYK7_9RHOB|nr:NlpC/P60 family protein [Aliiruegeria haliotis]PRY26222.1 NlpC/P60 family putative phage cell wall peptidase [Aliiruegeria haliotis]
MQQAEEVVEIARSWIGTPYRHQASCKGAGTDCLGLVRGVWRGLKGNEPCAVPAYSADWSEASRTETLWQAARNHLVTIPLDREFGPGEVLLFRMRKGSVAKHLGISARRDGGPSFIHAYSGHAVLETALSAPWGSRIVGRFAFPEGEF